MDWLTVEFITQMVIWVSVGASTLLCILIAMIYFRDEWAPKEKD